MRSAAPPAVRPIPELDRRVQILEQAKSALRKGAYIEAQSLAEKSRRLRPIVESRLAARKRGLP